MRKQFKVHALSTEKAPSFYQIGTSDFINMKQVDDRYTGRHLYITSDEEIKEGDIVLECNSGANVKPYYRMFKKGQLETLANTPCSDFTKYWIRKVVATTNPEFWTRKAHSGRDTGNPAQDIITVPTGIAKIDTDFIQAFVREQGIWEVMLEMEIDKELQYLVDKSALHGGQSLGETPVYNKLKLKPNGSVITHKVKEKMYTYSELYTTSYESYKKGIQQGMNPTTLPFHEWFNKHYPQ